MPAGIQFTNYVPTALIGVNSPSPTLDADVVTGAYLPTGAFPGNVFYLNEQQANQLSQVYLNSALPSIVAPNAIYCHAGWYEVVQVSSAATAGNIKFGAIGAVVNVPLSNLQAASNVMQQAVVTDGATASTAGLLGNYPCVFLGPVTPGNFTIVLIADDASLLLNTSSNATAVGSLLQSGSPGTVSVATTLSVSNQSLQAAIAQQVITPTAALTLSSVAAASGGTTVYTGTITNGGSNAFANQYFTITGFTGAAAVNNGTFICSASSTTTLTLSNPSGVAVTAAGTATALNLVRANVAFPFGMV